ncbi:DNA-DIRECTED RNA polymerase D SUBUNIT 2B-RELATED [Salix viminalis]|uniref:DNA-DIRECTED RNA polymerase D SUBUNIT 2B-RELATED n=1 Tax=Salix viminalis TaxID=40686 RepID=A0A9Q0U7B6_SALVM|nr:DNA-DIRECTED RNA polymerase D SUBUNIT 2B-RELATED [Salix viminalis]
MVSSVTKSTHVMLLSTVDSRGSLIHLVKLHDTSKQKDGECRCASVRLGKVALNRPSFWGGTSSDAEHNMFFRHTRLQNMTYSARMKIHVNVQVYTQTVGRSDKCKTGIDKVVQKECCTY